MGYKHSHDVLNRRKSCFSQLINVHNVSDVRQVEIHVAEPIAPGPCPFKVEIAISKSKSHYNWRSVSHYVKVSSPFSDLWPDITFCPKVVFWNLLSCLLRRPLWQEVGFVICLSISSNLPLFTSNIYVTCVLQFSNLYTINIKLQSVP
jgi:hypothetical protein